MQKIWLGEAKRQLHKGALKKAYDMALQILDTDREDPDAWGIMAQLALEGGNYKKSDQLSAKAIAYGAEAAWIKIGRARTLLYLGRQDEARILISSVEIGQCEHPIEIDTAGVVLARTGLHSQAVPCFEQAVSMEPGQVQFRYNLATALQFTGRLDEAADIFQSVLQIDPDHHRSRLALTQLTAQDDNALQDIEARFVRNIDDAENALLLGHAAARIYEDRGDHLTSLEWLLKAKAKKAQQAGHQKIWAKEIFAAAMQGKPVTRRSASQQASSGQTAPIFIIGMPRSGTTLVERILSSHSAVISGGELPDLALLVKRSGGSPGPHTLSKETLCADYDADFVGSNYLARTKTLASGSPFLIDKMPFNFFFVRHIVESLPDAHIIMVRRDPRDTVFANFRQLFATDFGYYNYSYDLNDCVDFVYHFNRLADYWRDNLPAQQYSEIYYEDMIADQDKESQRLISFAGLPWEEQCLQFHKNETPVATASSVQVRSPIHSGSIARWKRYGIHSRKVDEAFRQMGLDLPDGV